MGEGLAVDWAEFTWQAFATLMTGVLAVVAATSVALRQIALQKQIADTANQTALLKIKTDLFDKRVAVYEDVRVWIDTVIDTANNATSQDHATMRAAIDRSQFLFAPAVTTRLHDLFDDAVRHALHKRDPDAMDNAKADAAWKRLFKASNDGLYDLFGDELRMGDPLPKISAATMTVRAASSVEAVGEAIQP